MVILVFVLFLFCFMKICQLLFFKFFIKNCSVELHLDCQRVQQGEKLHLVITANNHQWLIIPGITFRITIPEKCKILEEFPLDESQQAKSQTFTLFTSLFSYQKITKKIPLLALERGYCEIHFEVIVNSLLNRATLPIPPFDPLVLIIHPQALPLDEIIWTNCGIQGSEVVRKWIYRDPVFYTKVRPYQPLDNFKDIDWKSTARLNQLYVKEYDTLSQPSYALFLLVQPTDTLFCDSSVFLEKAVGFCTTFIALAKQNQYDCALMTNAVVKMTTADTSFSQHSINHLISCLDVLAGVTPYPFFPMEKLFQHSFFQLKAQQQVFIIAQHFNASISIAISTLVKRHIPVSLVLEELDSPLSLPSVDILVLPLLQRRTSHE